MKITIDTTQDKPEEIRKMCELLLELTSNSRSNNAYTTSAQSAPVDTSSMMNMFGDDQTTTTSMQAQSTTINADRAPDFGAFLSLTKNYEKRESTTRPQIEFL